MVTRINDFGVRKKEEQVPANSEEENGLPFCSSDRPSASHVF